MFEHVDLQRRHTLAARRTICWPSTATASPRRRARPAQPFDEQGLETGADRQPRPDALPTIGAAVVRAVEDHTADTRFADDLTILLLRRSAPGRQRRRLASRVPAAAHIYLDRGLPRAQKPRSGLQLSRPPDRQSVSNVVASAHPLTMRTLRTWIGMLVLARVADARRVGYRACARRRQRPTLSPRCCIGSSVIVQNGDSAGFLALLSDGADRDRALDFAASELMPGVNRAVLQERDRAAAGRDAPPATATG